MFLFFFLCLGCSEPPAAEPLEVACTVTDGDTLRCGEERVRLLGIDAPEAAGHCRPGRRCAPGDPSASTAALRTAISGRALSIQRTGVDVYGRTLAVVRAGGRNLSCVQLESGAATYVARWDTQRAVARDCPKHAL